MGATFVHPFTVYSWSQLATITLAQQSTPFPSSSFYLLRSRQVKV